MGEAFIFGSGGGATVEHIVITNAESHTFHLTNPKRTYCKVFGSINSDFTANRNYYQGDYSDNLKRRLYGNQYMVSHKHDSYQPGSGWSNNDPTVEFDKDITITRKDGSITIELGTSYPYYAEERWASDEYGEYPSRYRTNTIDIYVVDYD